MNLLIFYQKTLFINLSASPTQMIHSFSKERDIFYRASKRLNDDWFDWIRLNKQDSIVFFSLKCSPESACVCCDTQLVALTVDESLQLCWSQSKLFGVSAQIFVFYGIGDVWIGPGSVSEQFDFSVKLLLGVEFRIVDPLSVFEIDVWSDSGGSVVEQEDFLRCELSVEDVEVVDQGLHVLSEQVIIQVETVRKDLIGTFSVTHQQVVTKCNSALWLYV